MLERATAQSESSTANFVHNLVQLITGDHSVDETVDETLAECPISLSPEESESLKALVEEIAQMQLEDDADNEVLSLKRENRLLEFFSELAISRLAEEDPGVLARALRMQYDHLLTGELTVAQFAQNYGSFEPIARLPFEARKALQEAIIRDIQIAGLKVEIDPVDHQVNVEGTSKEQIDEILKEANQSLAKLSPRASVTFQPNTYLEGQDHIGWIWINFNPAFQPKSDSKTPSE